MGTGASNYGKHLVYGIYKVYMGNTPIIMGDTPSYYGKHPKFFTPCHSVDNSLLKLVESQLSCHDMGTSNLTHTENDNFNCYNCSSKKAVNISQSNELTEAAYHLPLQAKRVLWLCLMQCYFNKENPEESLQSSLLLLPIIKSILKSVLIRHLAMLKRVNLLAESNVTFYPKEGEFEELKRPWLAEAGLKRGRENGKSNSTIKSCHILWG
jgi:hypothetical protein